jgi:UDP-N-acetyl-alpha-D-muramoyl-L-alanyl-L-glutamate epimerase
MDASRGGGRSQRATRRSAAGGRGDATSRRHCTRSGRALAVTCGLASFAGQPAVASGLRLGETVVANDLDCVLCERREHLVPPKPCSRCPQPVWEVRRATVRPLTDRVTHRGRFGSPPKSRSVPFAPYYGGVVHTSRPRGAVFAYEGFDLTADGRLTCGYRLDDTAFTERFAFDARGAEYGTPAADAAARLLFLVAGASYYKTGAPPVIRGPQGGLTERETDFLLMFYRSGLAEFSYRPAGIDIGDLAIEAGPRKPAPHAASPRLGAPLVPFGGGIDSVVVAEKTRDAFRDTVLFVANTSAAPFAPIEEAAAITGLPVRRVRRDLDPKVLKSAELGYFNGHVPVTGVLSAASVLAAVGHGHDRVVMSNERSASVPTGLRANGVLVNHQWSKGIEFEQAFRAVLADTIPDIDFFSALRGYSELWVGRQFAAMPEFHLAFRSCNRGFSVDEGARLSTWCGLCDKCCFIDLILAPYLSPTELKDIFRGNEPLENPSLESLFVSLLGQPGVDKPLECVGDEGECRTAVMLASGRSDRAENDLLSRLSERVVTLGKPVPDEDSLLSLQSPHLAPADMRW